MTNFCQKSARSYIYYIQSCGDKNQLEFININEMHNQQNVSKVSFATKMYDVKWLVTNSIL